MTEERIESSQPVGWNRCTCALDGVVCEKCGLRVEGDHWHLVPSRRLRLYEEYPTGIPYHEVCGSLIMKRALEEALPEDQNHIEVLLDLAREGNEATSRNWPCAWA